MSTTTQDTYHPGHDETRAQAMHAVADCGRIGLFGLPERRADAAFPFHVVFSRRATIEMTFGTQREPGLPSFREAPILLCGPNFGCGSSREGAVWALLARGIRCVIGESFGDIFFANCFQNGMLPLRLPGEVLARIAQLTADGSALTVDLVAQHGWRQADG